MSDKPFREMTDAELTDALRTWERHIKTAAGWASAHFAAKQVGNIVTEGKRRGLPFRNEYPIIFR